MGSDLEGFVEFRRPGQKRWEVAYGFQIGEGHLSARQEARVRRIWPGRSYDRICVLMGVRAYAMVPPLRELRGIPADATARVRSRSKKTYANSHTYYLLSELLAFDWSRRCENRRGVNGTTLPPGAGERTTYAEMVGQQVLDDVAYLHQWALELGIGPEQVRLVFWLDC